MPHRFAPKSYDARKLAILQDTFDETWQLLTLRFPTRTKKEDEHYRSLLAKVIVDMSLRGINDPQELFRGSIRGVLANLDRESRGPEKPKRG
jgi:hypothetical protein